MLDYTLANTGDALKLSLKGSLTFVDGEIFKNAIAEIQTNWKAQCIVEMGELDFVDSFGLGLFVVLYDLANDLKMHLVLRRPTGVVRERLNYTRFDTIVSIED
jgi:anti-anti-sigma factor